MDRFTCPRAASKRQGGRIGTNVIELFRQRGKSGVNQHELTELALIIYKRVIMYIGLLCV